MVPSNEALPTMGKLETPAVERHDGIVRAGDATPLGTSRELARALFDELAAGATADRIYEVRASEIDPMPQYVLIEMTAKELADVAAFEKQADRLVDRLAMTRGYQLFGAWLRDRCTTMARAGKLRPTARFLQTFDDQGRKLPITYQPCESLAQK